MPTDFDLQPYSHMQSWSTVYCLHLGNPWITTHLPTLEGWKAELAWLAEPEQTPYPQSGHMSTIDQA